jgi:hypothetical protein
MDTDEAEIFVREFQEDNLKIAFIGTYSRLNQLQCPKNCFRFFLLH